MYMDEQLQSMKNAVSTAHRRGSRFRSKSMLPVMVSSKFVLYQVDGHVMHSQLEKQLADHHGE